MSFQTACLEFFYFSILLLVGLTSGQTISTSAPSTLNSSCPGSMTCISDGNGSSVTFSTIPGINQVLINMTTTAIRSSGWLGLGFSYDTIMGNDSVIDCILLNNGTVIVKHSFNGVHFNNDASNATEGISNASLSSSNGVVQCLFQRQINGLMNPQIYSLDKPYYLFLAHGPVDSQLGTIQYHEGKYVTPQVMTVANSSNSSTPIWGYFGDSYGNRAAFQYLNSTNEMQFEITGPAAGPGRWIALGFSNDNLMGNDSVLDCILLSNGTVLVQISFNEMTKTNTPINSAGITLIGTSYQNGSLNCSFKRNATGYADQRIFPLDKPYYLLLAKGPVGMDGRKSQHDALPTKSSSAVDPTRWAGNVTRETPMEMTTASTPSNSTTPSNSSTLSGWSSFSDPQSSDNVQFKVSSDGLYVEFTIQRPSPPGGSGWVAVGFNESPAMKNSSVIDCILLANGSFKTQLSYNEPVGAVNDELGNPDLAIINITNQNVDGMMKCNLKERSRDSRTVASSHSPKCTIYSWHQDHSTLTQYHMNKVPSQITFNLTSSMVQNSSNPSIPVTPPNATTPSNSSTPPGWSSFNNPQSSDSVQFKVSSDGLYVEFTIQRPSPPGGSGWVAVGFNESPAMKNSSVIDCILMPNGSIKTQLSYNEPVGAANDELGNPDSAIINISNQNMDGVMKCNLKRKVSGFNDSRIFPFTKMYYLLLASGPLNADGTKQYHANRVPSQNTFNLTSTVGQNSSNTSNPVTPPNSTTPSNSSTLSGWSSFNNPQSSDSVQFKVSSDGLYVEFTIQRPSPPDGSGWVAVGFNEVPAMKNSSVIDCILMPNGSIKTQLSYNEPVGAVNDELGNPDSAIINIANQNMDGVMKCNLKRKVSGFTDNRIFPFTKMYYLLLASGPLNADGTKQYHMNKVPSQITFNLTSTVGQNSSNISNPVTSSNSSTLSGWSSFNDPQSSNNVQFKVSSDGLYVEFTIQRPSPPDGSGWVAVGFNEVPAMKNSSVIDCILMFNGSFKTQLSYNEPVGAGNDELGNPDSAIVNVTCTNMDGTMKCNLKRKVSGFNDSRIFPFTKMYYLLLASGPLNADGTKQYHTNKVPSQITFNLTSTEGQDASQEGRRHSNAPDPVRLLRAHAVLMLTTFVMLMSGAIILARYYKTCWPEDKICGTGVWFAVHRFLMVLGLFCCAAGFILIFCYSDGFLFRGFPTGSPSYYWVHGPLGIVVMCLIVINPIMAIFRCDPDHSSRWIYNWLHFFVGMSCQILAGITLFFGIKMGEQYYNLNHWSVFWILIAFVGFHVFIEFILLIEKLITQRFTKQESFTVTYGMSEPGEEPTAVKTGAGMVTRESLVFRYCVLTLYTTVTMALWLAMIILIGGGFYTTKSS